MIIRIDFVVARITLSLTSIAGWNFRWSVCRLLLLLLCLIRMMMLMMMVTDLGWSGDLRVASKKRMLQLLCILCCFGCH